MAEVLATRSHVTPASTVRHTSFEKAKGNALLLLLLLGPACPPGVAPTPPRIQNAPRKLVHAWPARGAHGAAAAATSQVLPPSALRQTSFRNVTFWSIDAFAVEFGGGEPSTAPPASRI